MATSPTPDYPETQEASTELAGDATTEVQDIENKDYTKAVSDAYGAYQGFAPRVPTLLKETKAGYKTTEFWGVIVWEALVNLNAIHLPGTWGVIIGKALPIATYILSRGLAKNGVVQEEQVGS